MDIHIYRYTDIHIHRAAVDINCLRLVHNHIGYGCLPCFVQINTKECKDAAELASQILTPRDGLRGARCLCVCNHVGDLFFSTFPQSLSYALPTI